jgi:hypothetical protein
VETEKRVVKGLGDCEIAVNIFWYYHRLRTMGPVEIAWRIRRLWWQFFAWLLHRRRELQYQNNPADSQTILGTIEKIKFHGLSDIKPKDVPKDYIDSAISAADELLLHHYDYLALGKIDLGREINWNHEYKRNIDTPLLFGPWMDYRDSVSFGDFKYFWELPRFQHLITLSKAYYLTGEEKYAKEAISQIKSFIEQSPYLLGVNWIMPMEASIRLVSISWITVFLKEHLKKDLQACVLIDRLVRSHIDYVTNNYAAYSSANNHLIAEAAGVFIASICFSGLGKIRSHQNKAFDILCREITRQNYEDGVNKEQAVHYQLFAFNFLLLAGLLGKINGIEFPGNYWKMLEKNAIFIAAIANDNCQLPEIGDSDDGRAILLSEKDSNAVRSLLAVSAVLFNKTEFKAKAGYFDEVSFWLLGRDGKQKFDNLGCQPSVSLPAKFEQGGYYILTCGEPTRAKIVFDCGPLGFGEIAAHGHADSLSFTLDAYNRAFFVDPGTYTYIATDPFRNYFRSTAAHNTVVIDSIDQSEMTGPFLWCAKADSFIQDWQDKDGFVRVAGQHDGYRRLNDPVIHKRSIELDRKKSIVIIKDYIEAMNSHTVEQYFHLAPGCVVKQLDANRFKITNRDRTIEFLIDEHGKAQTKSAVENPIIGWASHSYDKKEPITTIICRTVCDGNQCLMTRIILSSQN